MRLHRFYIQQEIVPGQQLMIDSAELVNQIRRVFRLKTGDQIILFNGTQFDYLGKIANYSDSDKMGHGNSMVVDIDPAPPMRSRFQPGRKVFLYAAVVKKDTFEWIVEKATELGVTGIVPVMAERSEKKNLNEERLKKIAIEASEQSGRGDVPVIHPIISLEEAAEEGRWKKGEGNAVVFHTEGQLLSRSTLDKGPIACFIGPEGGWSEREVELFHKNNVEVRTLGSQVLRAETAVIAALSQVVFEV